MTDDKLNELLRAVLALFPEAEVASDNGGQIIIYTGVVDGDEEEEEE